MSSMRCVWLLTLAAWALAQVTLVRADDDSTRKKVVFVAGKPSHGWGQHEHYAGSVLLAAALEQGMPNFDADVVRNGWPEDPQAAFAGAAAIVMYSDGGEGHMVMDHLDEVSALSNQGVGIACLHYAVEIPKGKPGDAMLDWIGGYFETHWSVNPHWTANFTSLPDHPVTRGVQPFAIADEWYYHMRFRPDMQGVTPVLSAIPPESTLARPDGPHSGNPFVRKEAGQPQHVAWVSERPGAGRGFGFTGGHFHHNWAKDDFRRLVLNAVVWIAQGEVPAGGVPLEKVTKAQLDENQDEPKPGK
ncbi:MAG: ThuA domain-containing protein [Pirellulales bacterium]|nr:ThuA domain-containing protein [Pirellulales bacterium]